MPRLPLRPLCPLLVAAAALGTPALAAQAPASRPTTAPAPAPAIPETPAGRVLRGWLDAFNSADTARMSAYYRTHLPDRSLEGELRFRQQTGGFELLTIERSAPRQLEFTVKERNGPNTAYGMLAVSDGEPARVTAFPLSAFPGGASPATMRLDAARRTRVVEGAAAQLDSFYVFPAVAKAMGDSMRVRLARGAYEQEESGFAFAARLNEELREISRDKHLRVSYSIRPIPPRPAGPPQRTPEMIARQRQQLQADNCGFRKAERLEGNVGYLRFDFFADPELCGATADSALAALAGTSALIVDLRDNGGGDPAMVAWVSSHLFAKRTHLNDLWTRETGKTEEFWTRDSVPGPRFGGDKPVFVLTSSYTFSGAEEFAYNLKALERATIIGETSGGGAHPVRGRPIDDHFMLGVPFARAINPITKTNWEGTGVAPDVRVPAADALAKARELARERPKG